jgi:NAD(P)-dependent dehydrogenase (short-subunit alcohol dehydrogenase family)
MGHGNGTVTDDRGGEEGDRPVDPLINRDGDPLRVLVVGASSGIGAATAHALADHGAGVVGAARRRDRVAALDAVTPVACDVRSQDDCTDAVEAAVEALGGLDALVYATGVTGFTPLDATGMDRWAEIFSVNLFGAAQVTMAALPHLTTPASDGRALFLTSDSAERPFPGLVVYGVSKAGLSAFCRGLAGEYPGLRITEVVVGPTVDTEAGDHLAPDELGTWFARWSADGYMRYGYQTSVDVAAAVEDTLRAEDPPDVVTAAADPS